MDSRLARMIDRFVTIVGMVGAWLLFLLAAVVCFDVITRKFFPFHSTMLQELEWHLHTVIFFLAIPMAYLRGAHVRIDIFRDRISDRGKAKLEICGILLLALPFTLLLLRYGVDFVAQSYVQHEGSTSMQGLQHRWIIKTIVPVGMILLVLALVGTLIRSVLFLRGTGAPVEAFATTEIPEIEEAGGPQ